VGKDKEDSIYNPKENHIYMIIRLSNEDLKKCEQFANSVLKTNQGCYGSRGQGNAVAIVRQITVGKMAELAVYHAFKRKYPSILPPDFEVYQSKDKSHSADLISTKLDGHIKSQGAEESKKYGTSWLFQKTDPLIVRPCNKDYLILCLVKYDSVDILGKIKATKVLDRYKEPKLKHLKGNKLALYWDDISGIVESV
jgi:hypothetical protein